MVRTPEWRELLARFRWLDRYLDGEPFAAFAADEERRVRAILRELGTGGERPLDAYPLLVLAGLAVFGAAAGVSIVRQRRSELADTLDWRPLVLVAAGAALHVLLAERAGFIVAAAALFWLIARAFDARHPLRDAAYALGFALASYVLFDYALQLPLPSGVSLRGLRSGVLGEWL
jgi:putative tricarboxylic transport membrane protein